jgi:hypothetical protein
VAFVAFVFNFSRLKKNQRLVVLNLQQAPARHYWDPIIGTGSTPPKRDGGTDEQLA